MEKRGVSDVITTVLIILLVLAAVAIIGGIILKNLGDATEKIEAGFNTVTFSLQGVKVNKDLNLVSFNLVRGAGQGNVKGYNVVIEDSSGQRYVQKFTQEISELETKVVEVWYPEASVSDVSKISVSPIIGTSTGKEFFSDIISNYKVGGNEPLAAPSGLVGYWKFDETSGTIAADSSGNGLSGNINNFGSGDYLASTNCKKGNCFNFDGTNNNINIPNIGALQITGDITILLWINPSSLGGNIRRTLVSKSPSGEFQFGYISESSPYGIWWFHGTSTNTWATMEIPSTSVNQWQHIGIVRDNTLKTVKGFYNGGPVGLPPGSYTSGQNPTTSLQAVTIGSRSSSEYFNGKIDEVMIFNRALSDSEVKAIYDGQNA